ncbi:MAG: GUN4 domain-containing protein [Cyanobacteriota bacterium]
MPRIFDNIESSLLKALREHLLVAKSADFFVGYFNLKGWKKIEDLIEKFKGGEGNCCRLLIGMENLPKTKIRSVYQPADVRSIREQIANRFRKQLISEIPTKEDEEALRKLSQQIKSKQLLVKLYLKKKLHAKLYLIHRHGMDSVGFVGSSNLTQSGLSSQEELNLDVTDSDTCELLKNWFNERWDDLLCINISEELAEVVTEVVDEITKPVTEPILIVPPPPTIAPAIPNVQQKKQQTRQEEVSLRSDVGLDYTKLRNLLAREDWDEADQETASVVLKVTRRQEDEDWEAEEWDEENLELRSWDNENLFDAWWSRQSSEKFPCSDLRTIDQLWLKYSEGRFGFSVQKNIWQEVGQDEDKFFERLGWLVKGNPLIIEEPQTLIEKLTDNGNHISGKKLRKGHLPLRVHCFAGDRTERGSYEMVYEYFFSRLEFCQD